MRMKSKTNINSDSNKIQLFEDQQIRSAWDGENEEWYFSIVDVVGVLTEILILLENTGIK